MAYTKAPLRKMRRTMKRSARGLKKTKAMKKNPVKFGELAPDTYAPN